MKITWLRGNIFALAILAVLLSINMPLHALPAPGRNSICVPGSCGSEPCDIRIYIDSGQYGAANCRTGDNYGFSTVPDLGALWTNQVTPNCPAVACDIYIETGNYTASTSIAIASNSHLHGGLNLGSILHSSSSLVNDLIHNKDYGTATTDQNIEIDHLTLEAWPSGAKAIRTSNLVNFKFHDLVENAQNGITIQDGSGDGCICNDFVNHQNANSLSNQWVTLVTILPAQVTSGGMPYNILIADNIASSWDDPVWVEGGTNITIRNNILTDIAGSQPVNLLTQQYSGVNSTINGVIVQGNTITAFAITGGSPKAIQVAPLNGLGNIRNVQILDNMVNGRNKVADGIVVTQPVGFNYAAEAVSVSRNTVNATTSAGFLFDVDGTRGNSRGFIISANRASFSQFEGFATNNLFSSIFSGNIAYANSQASGVNRAGFSLSMTNSTIEDNQAFDQQTTRTQYIGFSIGGTGNLIVGNNAWGNINAQFSITATSSVAIGNTGYNPQPVFSVTAGASPFTTTVQIYPSQIQITTLGGMTGWTCQGQTMINAVNELSPLLQPGKTCILTWATTAPVYEVIPQ